MEKIVFYLKEFHIGGAQLLIVRIAKKLVELGKSVSIIGIFEDENIFKSINEAGIKVVTIEKWDNDYIARRIVRSECDSAQVITMSWQDYCRVVYLKGNMHHVIFYATHRNDLINASKNRIKIVEYINKMIVKKAIKTLIKRKTIVAIDEDTVDASLNYYCFSENLAKEFRILRIAIDNDEDDDNKYQLDLRFGDRSFRVLSIARADFPFKGYLMGLVDCMRLRIFSSNTVLEIVSAGEDQEKLEKKVEECDEGTRKRIKLYGKINYNDLEMLYKRSKVFVGLGTALLDAAKYGIVSIPVVAYTYNVESQGFFHDDYRRIVAKKGSLQDFKKCIEWVEKLNKEKYILCYKKNKRLIKENYSTSKVVLELMGLLDGSAKNDDLFQRCKLSYLFYKMIVLIKHFFDRF